MTARSPGAFPSKAAGRLRLLDPGARAIGIVSLTVSALAACSNPGNTASEAEVEPSPNAVADSALINAPGPANVAAPAQAAPPSRPQGSIPDRVRQIIAEHLGVPLSRLTDRARLLEDLSADSLDHVELVMAMEEEFAVEISDDDAEQLKTVGDFISYVERNAAGADPAAATGGSARR